MLVSGNQRQIKKGVGLRILEENSEDKDGKDDDESKGRARVRLIATEKKISLIL